MDWRGIVGERGRSAASIRALLAACMLAPTPLQAQVSPPGFGGLKHARWGPDEGAPNGVFDITQTRDGYIWLAGDALYRFDGVSFERIDWPAGTSRKHAEPTGLLAGRDGTLWVGLSSNGGVAAYRGGQLVDTHMPTPPAVIGPMAQAPDGTIWAASGRYDRQLRRLRGGKWESVGDALGRPEGAIMGLAIAADGGVWMALTYQGGNSGALAYLAPGAPRFQLLPDRVSLRPRIALDPAGALWVSDGTGARMVRDQNGRVPARAVAFPSPPNVRTATLSFDGQGGLWRTTSSIGISYIPSAAGAAATAYPFDAANGLTSDFSYESFVDREGSVWIATETGIDQFRRASATQELGIPADPIHGLALAAANDGSVYIESNDTLFRIAAGGAPRPILKLNGNNLSMCSARAGGIWIAQNTRMLHVVGDRVETSPGFPGQGVTTHCAEDRQGRLWVAIFGEPLVWRDARGWHNATGTLGQQRVWNMIATPAGGIAFTGRPDLATFEGDRLTLRKGFGSATMLSAGTRDIFLSDDRGLVRLRDGKLVRLDQGRFPWLVWLRSLVQTDRGETWLVARTGISRVATADLDRAFQDPHAPLPRTLFNSQDGLVSAAQHAGFAGLQSAVAGDGRVWFLNRQGAGYFDPATLKQNALPPPVAIRSLSSGGRSWRDPDSLTLPPGTRALDIAYAGLSLAVPQRVHFRYRLDGVDDDWVDAGSRRVASYANLGPGSYRFHVIAANNDGVWNRSGAEIGFEIRPTFVQSWPFRMLCAVALVALLWLAYSMRMRVVASRIRLRMAERFEERERIARELHDTLLQAIQSLTLRFQLAVDDLPAKQPGRPALLQAIDTADQVIAEGRDRVLDLRSRQAADIEQIIRELIARQCFGPDVEICIATNGTPRDLDALALEETGRIAGEALFNIWRHACARRVEVEINYGASFALRIADDGVGIDPELAARGRSGHYGLAGMRERARRLRGSLVIRPSADQGTELLLTVPGGIAYKAEERSLLARLWSRR